MCRLQTSFQFKTANHDTDYPKLLHTASYLNELKLEV